MTLHTEPHPLAGKTVRVKNPHGRTFHFRIEDWWDRVFGGSWMDAVGNPACVTYAVRSERMHPHLPTDNEVLYGKIDGAGQLVHVSEIGAVVEEPTEAAS